MAVSRPEMAVQAPMSDQMSAVPIQSPCKLLITTTFHVWTNGWRLSGETPPPGRLRRRFRSRSAQLTEIHGRNSPVTRVPAHGSKNELFTGMTSGSRPSIALFHQSGGVPLIQTDVTE
jgi:hypothetical protein